MEPATTILYVADPMCSWCWGFVPVLNRLRQAAHGIPIRHVLGGLAPDSEEPMAPSMRESVQQAWHDVHLRTGAEFNFDFWEQCSPRRSTWPACRAVIVARSHGLEDSMFRAIQQAYYLYARNPSDHDTLADLALDLGMDRAKFLDRLHADDTQQRLENDFTLRRALGADSFPSLGVLHHGKPELLHRGWCDHQEVVEIWTRWREKASEV